MEDDAPNLIAAPSPHAVPVEPDPSAAGGLAATGGGQPARDDWRAGLQGLEKFRTPGDLGKSYLEAERRLSQATSESSALRKWLEDNVAPYWDDYAAFVAERLSKNARAGNEDSDEDEDSAANELEALKQELAEIKAAQQDFHRSGFETQVMTAIDDGTERFLNDVPEAAEMEEEIAAVISGGEVGVPAGGDLRTWKTQYQMAKNAYELVKGRQSDRSRQADLAAGVERGGPSSSGVRKSIHEMSAAELRANIDAIGGSVA